MFLGLRVISGAQPVVHAILQDEAVHVAYANQIQESFLDGHVRAFQAIGGVPTGMIRYDNLMPAVIRVALGRERFEHPRLWRCARITVRLVLLRPRLGRRA